MLDACADVLQDHPAIVQDLDLVEEVDQFTHLLTLEDAGSPEDLLSESVLSVSVCLPAC